MSVLRHGLVLAVTVPLLLTGLVLLTATSANAALTTLDRSGDNVVYVVCKSPETGGYGPVWKLTIVMATRPDYTGRATFIVNRGSSRVQTVELNARNGAWDVETTYASRILGDTWDTDFHAGQISTGHGLGGGFDGQESFSRIAYC